MKWEMVADGVEFIEAVLKPEHLHIHQDTDTPWEFECGCGISEGQKRMSCLKLRVSLANIDDIPT